MTINWTPLADLVETHDRFLITTHVRPDGDALGSEVGMAGLLRQKGKDVRVVNASPTPPRYDFLDPDGSLFEHYGHAVHASDLADREVAIILDLSAWGQLAEMAEFLRAFPGRRVVIDHHVSQDDMGATFFKDTTAEATGILVQSAVNALRGTLTREVAIGLMTAIAMDTGWFRHPSTRPRTMRAVAELMEAGADVSAIYRDLFERNTVGRLRLMGRTLNGLKTEREGRIAWAGISLVDLKETGSIPPDSEDLVDYTVSLRGVEVGMLLIEQARGGVKVSLRSRNGLDCSRLAESLGGGGHKAAAGATVPGTMEEVEAKALAAVRQALDSAPIVAQP
ncbi:DHH family phosphoesterase [Aquisphaera insulae]|uniref:DHH family phosphoesterase n=1 Tax=Aquisphaera insulae TaxID=2712864 RepID=UPI0013EAA05A|nr:DHH family phosphoesterase [Aquisphaera insulae]